MKKFSFALAALAALAFAVPAVAVKVEDPTPNGQFSQGSDKGYLEVAASDGAVLRACNENPGNPGGDSVTGYIWVNPGGEGTTPTYGNATIGAGDYDGEGVEDGNPNNGTEENDCP